MERKVVSFVRRNGRITKSQQRSLAQYLGQYGLDLHGWCDWNSVFGNDRPVVLDIGFGNGDDLFSQACNHPQYNFVGIEVYRAGIGALLGKVAASHLQHVRVIDHDAVEVVSAHVPTSSVSRIQLLFPDPWHKKRHHKRRIIQPKFVEVLCRALRVDGVLHIVTDCAGYAAHIDEIVGACTRFKRCLSTDEALIHFDRLPTRFEQRGLKKGHKIYEFSFVKHRDYVAK